MKKITLIAALGGSIVALSACDVAQTEEGDMPEVSIEGGELPEYDVDVADVEITTEEKTIEVPVVDVDPADAGAPD